MKKNESHIGKKCKFKAKYPINKWGTGTIVGEKIRFGIFKYYLIKYSVLYNDYITVDGPFVDDNVLTLISSRNVIVDK